jgi:hypothetical protein
MLPRERVEPVLPKCAACAQPSAITVDCWGFDLCSACHGTWWTDERFSSGAIEKAAGIAPWVQGESTDRSQDGWKYTAEAVKRTTAWVAERSAKARAA